MYIMHVHDRHGTQTGRLKNDSKTLKPVHKSIDTLLYTAPYTIIVVHIWETNNYLPTNPKLVFISIWVTEKCIDKIPV